MALDPRVAAYDAHGVFVRRNETPGRYKERAERVLGDRALHWRSLRSADPLPWLDTAPVEQRLAPALRLAPHVVAGYAHTVVSHWQEYHGDDALVSATAATIYRSGHELRRLWITDQTVRGYLGGKAPALREVLPPIGRLHAHGALIAAGSAGLVSWGIAEGDYGMAALIGGAAIGMLGSHLPLELAHQTLSALERLDPEGVERAAPGVICRLRPRDVRRLGRALPKDGTFADTRRFFERRARGGDLQAQVILEKCYA